MSKETSESFSEDENIEPPNGCISKMKLFSLCLHVIGKQNVILSYLSQLEYLPVNIKTALFTILSKRGIINDKRLVQKLLNPAIKTVDLSECIVTDEILSYLPACENLRKLDLSLRRRQNRQISSSVLSSIFQNLHKLNILAIPHCQEFTDDVVMSISKHCKNLRELHIPNSAITDEGLRLIGQNLNFLSVINLLGSKISDAGIRCLVIGPLSKMLKEINIDKCSSITLESSCMIDKNCPNIQIFTCGGFSDYEMSGATMDGIRLKAKQVFWSV